MTDAHGLPCTLSRSIAVIEAAARHGPVTFQEAVALLGSVPSTVSRLLNGLIEAQWLVHGAEGGYGISPRLQNLAHAIAGSRDLSQEAATACRALASSTGESAAVFVPLADGLRLLAKSEPEERFRYMALGGITRRIASHGFCVLRAAWWTEDEAQGKFSEQLPPPTLKAASWLKRLRKARTQRWLRMEDGDLPGLSRIAAAVVEGPQLLAVIGITATTSAITQRQRELTAQVRLAATELSTRIRLPS